MTTTTTKDSGMLQSAVAEAITEQTTSLLEHLSVEQQSALESKFNTLAQETRSEYNAKYPQLSVVARYVVRQMTKEANSKLASNLRPEWFRELGTQAAGLRSGNEEIRKYSEQRLVVLAVTFDTKEAISLLKKYKNSKDMTSENEHIKQLCGIFEVSSSNLK